MFKDYASHGEAAAGLVKEGITGMNVEIVPVMGGRFQPVIICDFEADLQRCQKMGFNARLASDYAYDG